MSHNGVPHGIIRREPRLQLAEWLECVERHSELVKPPPRNGVNPFTKGPWVFLPAPGEVHVLLDGARVGTFLPSTEFDEDGEIELFIWKPPPSDRVGGFAAILAKELGATLEWLDTDY
jgi:hypothetical protein